MTIASRTCATVTPGAQDPIYVTCAPPVQYQSLYYHRPAANLPGKSHWRLSRNDECHAFCEASDRGWEDDRGKRWFVAADAGVIGTNRERVATFTQSNASIPWHGYPVSTLSGAVARTIVPSEVLRVWEQEGATTRGLLRKLWSRRA